MISKWRKVFNTKSCHNELFGQLMFHWELGILCPIKINILETEVTTRVHIMLFQRSRSGKNQGFLIAQKTLKKLKPVEYKEGKIKEKKQKEFIIKQIHRTSDVVLLDRLEKDNPTPEIGIIDGTNPCG